MKKIAIYTCITGNYDNLREIENVEEGLDYYCFTNNKDIKSNTWKIIYIENNGLDNHNLSRKIKILGHPIINNNYEISFWLDASVKFEKNIRDFINNYFDYKNYSFAVAPHNERDCIYEEAKECVKLKKDKKKIILKQMKFYKKNKFPEHYGLCAMTVFIKKHNDPIVKETMDMWYKMVCTWSKRDQLSFMWCVYNTNLKIQYIPINIFDNNWFTWINHNKIESTSKNDIKLNN